MDKQKILVTFANLYDVEGVKGMTLNYFFFGDHGEFLAPVADYSGGPVGYQRAKCSMNCEAREKITFVPGIYNATFSMSVGSDGKPVMKVADLEFLGQAEIKMVSASSK